MICFFHKGDLDGHCSGAIVRSFGQKGVKMVGVDYEEPLPQIDLRGHHVWMVDFSYPMELMYHIMNTAESFTWIDHHAPRIEEARKNGIVNMINGLQEVGLAACELTWKYIMSKFFGNYEAPPAVHMLGRYDVFDHESDPNILPFQYGMRAKITDPGDDNTRAFWELLFHCGEDNPFLSRIINDGSVILRYLKLDDKKYADRFAHAGTFAGIPAVLLNDPPGGSRRFESTDFPGRPLLVSYGKLPSPTKWLVHLYSFDSSVDCGKLAKTYGGGGHKGAAGFVADAADLAALVKVGG